MPDLQLSKDLIIHYNDINPTSLPPVLLLHGLGVTCESWAMQVPALQEAGFRILIPDARGFGKSSFPQGSTTIRHMAGDIAALLRATDAIPAHVVGISMGGALALQMALDTPYHVSSLVLINTFSHLRPQRPGVWVYFVLRFLMVYFLGIKAQAHAVAKRLFPDTGHEELRSIFITQISQADPAGYRAAMRALARFNVSKRLTEISTPTLVVTGDQDTTVPLENQRSLAENIPGAQHIIIPGAGHAVTVEKPEQLNNILVDFLTSRH